MIPENLQPYQPPRTELALHSEADAKLRMSQQWWLVPFLYPLVLLATFYGSWLVAWCELGHMPRPSIDDPGSIGGMFRFCFYLPLLVSMLIPMMLSLGFIFLFYLRTKSGEPFSFRKWWLMLASYVSLWLFTFLILRWDPLGVVEWYGD